MTPVPSAKDVWKAFLTSSFVQKSLLDDEDLDAVQKFVEALPIALAAFLDEPLTSQTFMRAKAAAKRYAMSIGWIDAIAGRVNGTFVEVYEGWGPSEDTEDREDTELPETLTEPMVLDRETQQQRLINEIDIYEQYALVTPDFAEVTARPGETVADRLLTSPWDFLETPDWMMDILQ